MGRGMTEEQYAALQAQMNGGGAQAPTPQPVQQTQQSRPVQQAQQTQPTQQQASTASRQSSLRDQMRNARGAASGNGQQVVLQQTENYQPQGTTQTTQSVQSTQQAQPTQPTQASGTGTIINTTQSGNSGGGFKLSKPLVFGIIAIVIVVGIIGVIMLKSSGSGDDTSAEVNEDDLEWLDPVNVQTFLYTPDEITSLRAAGYTGDEIESYQTQQTPASDLIQQAEAERDAWIQEAIAPLYDTASDEYKHYVSQTWLTLPQRTDMEEWTMTAAMYNERKNLDYEKIDVYGNQLFIKVYLDDSAHEDWFFLCVTPDEWNKLKDSGNVIVNYTYCTHLVGDDYMTAVEDESSIYITAASLEIIE